MLRSTLIASAILSGIAAAQCPTTPGWSAMNAFPGLGVSNINNNITKVTASTSWDPDGAGPISPLLVVAGDFTYAGGVSASGIATWDGISWQSIGGGFGYTTSPLSTNVYALTVYQGELIAGGHFTTADGLPVANVARWSGSAWQPLGTGLELPANPYNANVYALSVYQGELIAGGQFTIAGGVPAANVARWNGSSWLPLASGLGTQGESVRALTSFGGDLIAGGYFAMAGAATVNSIARWDGTAWNGIGGGFTYAGYPATVYALATYGAELIALGEIGIARWNGTTWQSLPSPFGGYGRCLAVYGGDLVAGGGGAMAIARWNGSAWLSLGAGIQGAVLPPVLTLTVWGTELVAGGYFIQAGTSPANLVARWNGSSWRSLGTGMNAAVEAFGTWGSDLVAAGRFRSVLGASVATSVARWAGASWDPLGPAFGYGPDQHVQALCEHQGLLVAAGVFASPGNNIARWNGSSWQPLGLGISGPLAGATTVVTTLASWGGNLYAGGTFNAVNGNPAAGLLRWNGVSWQAVGGGLNGPVLTLGTYAGELIAGGPFTLAGGVPANGIARFDGISWHPLGTGVTVGAIYAMTTMGGDLFVGGTFLSVGGVSTPSAVARWDGSSWSAVGTSGNFGVYTLAVSNGSLFAAADWSSGVTNGIARFDGATWQPLGTGLFPVAKARALADHGGELFVGGNFFSAGGVISPYLARWSTPHPSVSLSQPDGPGTGVSVTNVAMIPGHEYYNVFSDSLCGAPGTGPYLGLCAPDPSFLLFQVTLPVGALPIHFVAPVWVSAFGDYQLPPGLALDGVCFDWTGGTLGCWSPVARFQVQ